MLDIEKDHPRTCGENHGFSPANLKPQGSPPHLRGKHDDRVDTIARERITPAPAGKTRLADMVQKLEMDHPRTCGENFLASEDAAYITGSPPHLRGKH